MNDIEASEVKCGLFDGAEDGEHADICSKEKSKLFVMHDDFFLLYSPFHHKHLSIIRHISKHAECEMTPTVSVNSISHVIFVFKHSCL